MPRKASSEGKHLICKLFPAEPKFDSAERQEFFAQDLFTTMLDTNFSKTVSDSNEVPSTGNKM